jgi:hypothetical protein
VSLARRLWVDNADLAERALAQEADDAVEDVVGAVLAHEVAFWDMAEQGDG